MRQDAITYRMGVAAAAAAPILVGAMLAPARESLPQAQAVLLLALPVVLAGAVGGRASGAAAAVTGALSFDFFFTEPYLSLVIDSEEDIATTALLLAVGLVVGQLGVLSRRRNEQAATGRDELSALFRVSRLAAQGAAAEDVETSVRVELLGVLALARCWLDTEPRGRRVLDPSGALTDSTRRFVAGEYALPDEGVAIAALGGAGPALVGAVSGFLLANWYFTPPFYEWKVAQQDDLVALVTFLVVAAVVSSFVIAVTQREAEARSARSEAAVLARANELRAALLAAVSHDLRTPLASIKASVTSLLEQDVDWGPADRREFCRTIDEEADRLDRLIANLLDMSRLTTNAVQVSSRPVGLEEIAAAALASLGHRARERDVVVDVPETLPRVRTDPGLLERAIANLVDNAIAWSPPGCPVRVEAEVVASAIHLRVIDQGPGIRPSDRERVFQPFQRLGDSGTGVGLGLAVTRGLVRALGGAVSVEDTAGGGTTMLVALPLAAA